MTLKYGNLMENLIFYKSVFITANAFVKSNGKLVMGRGFALSCAQEYPELPAKAGKRISGGIFGILENVHVDIHDPATYGSSDPSERVALGLFQVKFNWWEDARLDLVEFSTRKLAQLADENPDEPYALNYPAIGNGKISKELVEPIIETLPDNVDVWQFRSRTNYAAWKGGDA